MARLEAQNVRKQFASTVALDSFSHVFADGKITVVLGPRQYAPLDLQR